MTSKFGPKKFTGPDGKTYFRDANYRILDEDGDALPLQEVRALRAAMRRPAPKSMIASHTIEPVDKDALWYHGTDAPHFDDYQESPHKAGVSFTQSYDDASLYSSYVGGENAAYSRYKDAVDKRRQWELDPDSLDEEPIDPLDDPKFDPSSPEYVFADGRVISNRLTFPDSGIPYFIESNNSLGGNEFHAEAAAMARAMGYSAYIPDKERYGNEVVVLDPRQHVVIVDQDSQRATPSSITDTLPSDQQTASPSIGSSAPNLIEEVATYNRNREQDRAADKARLGEKELGYRGMPKESTYSRGKGRGGHEQRASRRR